MRLANRKAEGREDGGPFFELRFHVSLLTLIAFFIGDAVVTLDDVGGEDGVFLLPNRKKAPTSVSLVPWLLFYDAFASIIMLCLVIEHTFFAGVGVTINTEVAAGVVHSDVLAYHATANFTLTCILDLTSLFGDRGKSSEHVTLRPFEGVEVIDKFLVVGKDALHQFAIYASIVFNAV